MSKKSNKVNASKETKTPNKSSGELDVEALRTMEIDTGIKFQATIAYVKDHHDKVAATLQGDTCKVKTKFANLLHCLLGMVGETDINRFMVVAYYASSLYRKNSDGGWLVNTAGKVGEKKGSYAEETNYGLWYKDSGKLLNSKWVNSAESALDTDYGKWLMELVNRMYKAKLTSLKVKERINTVRDLA